MTAQTIVRLPYLASVVAAALLVTASVQAADKLDRVVETEAETSRAAAASQKRINNLDEKTRQMLEEWRQATWRAEQLKVYHAEMEKLIAVQRTELADLQLQLEGVGSTHPELQPLMLRMVNRLEQSVELDLPFELAARRSRITLLREALADGTTGLAEKFRKVLEAYQAELAYGREVEVTRQSLSFPGGEREVQLLRLGRTMLYYRTLDGEGVGYWDRDNKRWQPLPVAWREPLRRAILVARDRAVPELLRLPVDAPSKASEVQP